MTWNYRIVLHDEDPDPEKHWYGLHECHYGERGIGWSKEPTTFVCGQDEGPETIIKALEMAIDSLRKNKVIIPGDRSTWDPAPREKRE